MEEFIGKLHPMTAEKEIYLIRHAESHANVGVKTADPAGVRLTKQGHQQAVRLAENFEHKPDLIITSPYIRTLQTAQPLLKKYPSVQHEQWPVYEFTYLCPKRCDNTTMEQRIPWATEYWQKCDPHYQDGDGSESFGLFVKRATKTLEKLHQIEHKRIVIFSHMLFISSLNWLKQKAPNYAMTPEAMLDFREYLFENSVGNCQIIYYQL